MGNNEVMKEEVTPQPTETAAEEPATAVETTVEKQAPEAESAEEETTSQVETPRKVYETKAEILERIREIAHGDEAPQKEEVDYLKTAFYKLHIAEREASFKAYTDGGGDPEQYQITPDEQEEAVVVCTCIGDFVFRRHDNLIYFIEANSIAEFLRVLHYSTLQE